MGNVGIYSVGAKGVNQIVQSGRTECLAGVSREGLTREVLTRHSDVHEIYTIKYSHIYIFSLTFMLFCD